MKEEVYTHRSLETGGTARQTGPHQEAPELARRRRELGKIPARAFMFSVGRNGQGSVNGGGTGYGSWGQALVGWYLAVGRLGQEGSGPEWRAHKGGGWGHGL